MMKVSSEIIYHEIFLHKKTCKTKKENKKAGDNTNRATLGIIIINGRAHEIPQLIAYA